MLQAYRIISCGIDHFQMTGPIARELARCVTVEFYAKYAELSKN